MKDSKSKQVLLAFCGVFLAGLFSVQTFAAPKTDEVRLIVKFKQELTNGPVARTEKERQKDKEKMVSNGIGKAAKYLRKMGTGSDVMVIEGANKNDMKQILKAVERLDEVEFVEEDIMMQHYLTPNDPLFQNQNHYFDQGTSINAPEAWDKATGAGVVVAVVDTGYRPHVDLVGNILPGYDFISDAQVANDGNGRDSDARDTGDATAANECGFGQPAQSSSWHGTHVSGTVAAVTNNGEGVAGVAFGAKVVPVRVLGRCGGFTSDIADGILWASGASVPGVPTNANPAQVINMSLGGSGGCSQTYVNAINTARANGTTVVIAAGNSNVNVSNATPANCPGVIAVAATGPTGSKAGYSNFGSLVDIAAPGGDFAFGTNGGVLSTLNSGSGAPAGDNYVRYQGTSMATPHVAGIAALLYESDPSATPDEIEAAIVNSAQNFPGSCSGCGAGIADASAAIDEILGSGSGGGGGGTNPDFTPINFSVGVPRTTRNNFRHYTLNLAAGASELNVNITGGSGDADLYIRFGAQPTTTQFDFRPFLDGNEESVSIGNPQAGTWYISVRAFTTFDGVTLFGDAQ